MIKYPALFIGTGNMRDTLWIAKELEKLGIHAHLASYTGMEYGKIRPCSFKDVRIEDSPEWTKRITKTRERFREKRTEKKKLFVCNRCSSGACYSATEMEDCASPTTKPSWVVSDRPNNDK